MAAAQGRLLSVAAIDTQEAERVDRKLFRRLILPIGLLTFVNSIDRVNISYAGHAMAQEIGLTPEAFGLGVSAFFVAYLLFQYPHARLLRIMGVRLWIFTAMLLWGVAGLGMARVQTAGEFYAARFLLGVAEAGFAPGMTYFISQWVPRSSRATAMAGALSAVPLSMVLGGPLCGWLLGIGNPVGLSPWRWMFLMQAIPNFLIAGIAAAYFVDRPSQARWLAPAERASLTQRLAEEEGAAPSPSEPSRWALARDPWVWRCCVTWLLVMTGSYALVFWLPQLVRQLGVGQSEFAIATLSALPQLGMVCGLLLNGRHSDKSSERIWHVGIATALAGVAMLVAAFLPTGWPVLLLLIAAGTGIGAAQGVFWTIPSTVRIGGETAPVGVIALISMFGTAGGIVGPLLTGEILSRTGSFAPAIAILAALLILSLFVLILDGSGRGRRPAVDA